MRGPRSPGSDWGPVKPIVPKAKKASGIVNTLDTDIASNPTSQRGRSKGRVSSMRTVDAGFELTMSGQNAYETLLASAPKVDLTKLVDVEERIPGDREKLMKVLENLALGARHKEALGDVDWVWSNLSVYRTRYPVVSELYKAVSALGEETRKILRLDEAHRRATEGTEEDVFSPSGKLVGHRIRYSDALLTLFLKADHPDKFTERHEVKNTGVVLNMAMGLRENVRETMMEQGDIVIESPFAEEKPEEPES